MNETLYRRPLPEDAIAFSSSEGRRIFAEALSEGTLDGYFRLAEQFHTQSEPAFCGLGSLVVALNALAIDPGRLWKGPWRWFAEDLLDCCVPLSEVRERGLDLDEVACLARCNGADVVVQRAHETSQAAFRDALREAASGETVLLAAYDRSALGQTGAGHFSPLAGYHVTRDLVLILDVARFKYPPHWVAIERLWKGMQTRDPTTDMERGWLMLRPRTRGVALAFSLNCVGESFRGLGQRLLRAISELGSAAPIEELARTVLPLAAHVELRMPQAPAHQQALRAAQATLQALPGYPRIAAAVGPARAEAVALLLLAEAEQLSFAQRAELGTPEANDSLSDELGALHAQLRALRLHAEACAVPARRALVG